VFTIGNCIRSATRLLGGRTCRSMHWRSHEVFGNKVVPRSRQIPQFLTESSPDPQSSRHMHQLWSSSPLRTAEGVGLRSNRSCGNQSPLPPIATAKADSRKRSCLLYPESGHVQHTGSCLLWANNGSRALHFAVTHNTALAIVGYWPPAEL